MEEVQVGQPKKVFVHHNLDNASFYTQRIITEQGCVVTQNKEEADIVVIVWIVDKNKEAIPFLTTACEQFKDSDADIIFACVDELRGEYDFTNMKETLARTKWKDIQIAQLQPLRDQAKFQHGSQVCNYPINTQAGSAELKKILASTVEMLDRRRVLEKEQADILARQEVILADARKITQQKKSGELTILSEAHQQILQEAAGILQRRQKQAEQAAARSVAERPAAAMQPVPAAQTVSFFGYGYAQPDQASSSHSRQISSNYAEENLRINAGDPESSQCQKLIMLFALYMSIEHTIFNIPHINSTLSKALENRLAEELMDDGWYGEYKVTHEIDRATVRGKNYDRVSLELKRLLLKRYPGAENILNVLTEIFRCADKLERGTFSYNSPEAQQQIRDTLELARKVYIYGAHKQKLTFTEAEIGTLTKDLQLPSDAIKAVQKLVPDPRANPLLTV